MKKWKLYLGLLVVFLAGVVVGTGGTLLVVVHEVKRLIELGPAAGPEIVMRRLDRVLDLSDEQAAAIEPIVMDGYHEILELRSQSQPQRHAIVMDTVARLKTELTPEQAARLDAELAKAKHHLGDAAKPPSPSTDSPDAPTPESP